MTLATLLGTRWHLRIACAALCMALALSGCVNHAQTTTTTGSSSTSVPSTGPPTGTKGPFTASNSTFGEPLKWTDCVGFFSDFVFVGDTNPGQHPPGWDRQADQPNSGIDTQGWECQRVSWGPFERGPVRMVFESHSNYHAPPKCQLTNATGMDFILASWWISDADLAHYAATVFHAPAYYSQINVTTSNVGPTATHAWSWGLAGEAPSQMSTVEGLSRSYPPVPLTYREYWFDGQAVYYMDSHPIQKTPDDGGRVSYGEMYPPMLMAKVSKEYVQQGNWFSDAHMDASFAAFKDLQCEHPGP